MPDNAAIRKLIGERIRSAREARDLSRRDVAVALDVSTQAVWMWEKGDTTPTPTKQLALAADLGVAWSDLFSLDGEVA